MKNILEKINSMNIDDSSSENESDPGGNESEDAGLQEQQVIEEIEMNQDVL